MRCNYDKVNCCSLPHASLTHRPCASKFHSIFAVAGARRSRKWKREKNLHLSRESKRRTFAQLCGSKTWEMKNFSKLSLCEKTWRRFRQRDQLAETPESPLFSSEIASRLIRAVNWHRSGEWIKVKIASRYYASWWERKYNEQAWKKKLESEYEARRKIV